MKFFELMFESIAGEKEKEYEEFRGISLEYLSSLEEYYVSLTGCVVVIKDKGEIIFKISKHEGAIACSCTSEDKEHEKVKEMLFAERDSYFYSRFIHQSPGEILTKHLLHGYTELQLQAKKILEYLSAVYGLSIITTKLETRPKSLQLKTPDEKYVVTLGGSGTLGLWPAESPLNERVSSYLNMSYPAAFPVNELQTGMLVECHSGFKYFVMRGDILVRDSDTRKLSKSPFILVPVGNNISILRSDIHFKEGSIDGINYLDDIVAVYDAPFERASTAHLKGANPLYRIWYRGCREYVSAQAEVKVLKASLEKAEEKLKGLRRYGDA